MDEKPGWTKENLKRAGRAILIGAIILILFGWIFFGASRCF